MSRMIKLEWFIDFKTLSVNNWIFYWLKTFKSSVSEIFLAGVLNSNNCLISNKPCPGLNICNGIDMWTGPLAYLSLSSVDVLDKDQGSQSGIGSLLLLFTGFERKLKELKCVIPT